MNRKARKQVASLACGIMMASSMVAPTFAAVTSNGGTDSVPVELNAEATKFSVTVPTGLPVNVAADGTITVSQNNSIVNKSFGPIEVKGAKINTANGWTLNEFISKFERAKVNAKEFGFQLNGSNVNTNGSVAVTNFKPIAGNSSQKFTYDANVAPQSDGIEQQIATVVFTLGWYDGNDPIAPAPDPEEIPDDPVLPAESYPHATGSPLDKSMMDAQIKSVPGVITISRDPLPSPSESLGKKRVNLNSDGTVVALLWGTDAAIYSQEGGGVFAPADLSNFFKGYSATTLDLDGLDTSKTTNMDGMFQSTAATYIKGTGFDTRNVQTMNNMFASSKCRTISLGSFNTGKLTSARGMFNGSTTRIIDMHTFDLSSNPDLTNMLTGVTAKAIYCRTEDDMNKMKNSVGCTVDSFIVKDPLA